MSWSAQINVKIIKEGKPVFWSLDFPLTDRPESENYQPLPPVTLSDLVSIRDTIKATRLAEHNARITVRFTYSGMTLDSSLGPIKEIRYSKRNDVSFNPLTSSESLRTLVNTIGKTPVRAPKGMRTDEQY